VVWLPDSGKFEDTFIRFDRIHERDGRTDTARHELIFIASRGNKIKCNTGYQLYFGFRVCGFQRDARG